MCLKLEIIKKVIGLVLLVAFMNVSVKAIAWSAVGFSFISAFANMLPIPRLIHYSIREQIKDIMPITIIAIIAGAVSTFLGNVSENQFVVLLLQTLSMFSVFAGLSFIKCKEQVNEIKNIVAKVCRKH